MADEPFPDEPHHTRCPAYNGRWCYREACDSALGCIEFRRGGPQPRKNGPWWMPRYWIARGLIMLGLFLLPDSRYKRDLLIVLYRMRQRVEEAVRTVVDGPPSI